MSRALLAISFLVAGLAGSTSAQERLTPEGLMRLIRVGGATVSPDGKSVLYAARSTDLAKNSGDSDLWLVPIGGGAARQLTSGPGSESDVQWAATRKGTRIFFTARRGEDAAPQVWVMNPVDGETHRVTDVEGGVANLVVAPTGDRIAFTRDVKLDPTIHDVYPDLPLADARIIDSLMYRHWDSWHDFAYSHLHTAALDDELVAGAAKDLMAGLATDCPVPPFGGSEQFAWSPDGEQIAFTMKIVARPETSTDSDVYVSPWQGGADPVCLTQGMDGYDNDPTYSPDGKFLAFQSMERPGFESDRNRIMLIERETGSMTELTAGLDRSTHHPRFAPDSKSLYFESEEHGTDQVFRLGLDGDALKQLTSGAYDWSLEDLSPDGATMILGRENMIRPVEIGSMSIDGGEWKALTDVNGAVFSRLALPTVEPLEVRATDGATIFCWLIKPPGFDPSRKYPLLTYAQGGPQSQVSQFFSYRWNFHLMAAKGYVVIAPNRRGLPGFGQAWNDEISKDWGGQAMQDILAATDAMLVKPYVDPKRVAAVGASFGGYTAYWLMGHAEDRFAAIIAHAGIFDLESMYGTTEELFFANWDMGGPYWQSEDVRWLYEAFSPNRAVASWKTPLLVIHGEKDFRVPVSQGMEAFTAAQVRGVPSRFLYFPGEGHWILSPQNAVLWQRVFFDWLDRWTAPR